MRALVVLNGECDEDFLKGMVEEHEVVVGVDGGCENLLRIGVEPNVAVGDFDSFDPAVLSSSRVERYPSRKDEVDAQLALDLCRDRGMDGVTVVCWMGERLDMVLALFHLLARYEQGWVVLESKKLRIGMVESSARLESRPGEIWSILPLGGRAVVTLRGFEYEVTSKEMPVEFPYGVSNVSRGFEVGIEVEEGRVIYFRWKERPS